MTSQRDQPDSFLVRCVNYFAVYKGTLKACIFNPCAAKMSVNKLGYLRRTTLEAGESIQEGVETGRAYRTIECHTVTGAMN